MKITKIQPYNLRNLAYFQFHTSGKLTQVQKLSYMPGGKSIIFGEYIFSKV